jgi:hypothetical protein
VRLTRSVGLALGYSKKIWQLKPRLPLTSFVHFNSAQVNGLKYLKYITADNLAEESLKKLHLILHSIFSRFFGDFLLTKLNRLIIDQFNVVTARKFQSYFGGNHHRRLYGNHDCLQQIKAIIHTKRITD